MTTSALPLYSNASPMYMYMYIFRHAYVCHTYFLTPPFFRRLGRNFGIFIRLSKTPQEAYTSSRSSESNNVIRTSSTTCMYVHAYDVSN